MTRERDLAYRYDLFITPDWRDRFDTLVNEKIKLPSSGRILDVNCGTGAHAIELASGLRDKGEVIGLDPGAERIEIARAKAQAKKLTNVIFERSLAEELPFGPDEFDVVIGDGSMSSGDQIEDLLTEMARVARVGSRVILKVASHGSFDELFSIYWEALLDGGLTEQVWPDLERLINERQTITDLEAMAERAGLERIESFTGKEEFSFATAEELFSSPLVEDIFLNGWLDILPDDRRQDILDGIGAIIDRERQGLPFDLSIKATIITGVR